ncbi:DNA replication and checkpoint protein-domain-containing protein [Blastocladiella britannica]|nr:DNA replication and checkpoint protein-domain-containing protein [Blastocladiella britannica]
MASNNNPEVLSPELKALRSEIKNWERQFAQANGRKPSKDDVKKDKNAVELYKRFNKMKTAASLASQSPPLSPPAAVNEAAAPANLLSSTEVAVPDVPIVAEARVKVAIAVAPPVQDQEQERVQPQGQVQEPEQEHQGVRPTTATGISRAEALRKSQALRKRHQGTPYFIA